MPINMNQKLLLASFVAEAAANQSIHRSIAWRRLVKKAKLWVLSLLVFSLRIFFLWQIGFNSVWPDWAIFEILYDKFCLQK